MPFMKKSRAENEPDWNCVGGGGEMKNKNSSWLEFFSL